MKYEVLIKPSAAKEAERIPKKQKDRIRQEIRNLSEDPRPSGARKLKGKQDIYRVRVSDYRVLYTVDDREKKIRILSVLARKEAYR
jgi:mRNA interferase RelE/StbE